MGRDPICILTKTLGLHFGIERRECQEGMEVNHHEDYSRGTSERCNNLVQGGYSRVAEGQRGWRYTQDRASVAEWDIEGKGQGHILNDDSC